MIARTNRSVRRRWRDRCPHVPIRRTIPTPRWRPFSQASATRSTATIDQHNGGNALIEQLFTQDNARSDRLLTARPLRVFIWASAIYLVSNNTATIEQTGDGAPNRVTIQQRPQSIAMSLGRPNRSLVQRKLNFLDEKLPARLSSPPKRRRRQYRHRQSTVASFQYHVSLIANGANPLVSACTTSMGKARIAPGRV